MRNLYLDNCNYEEGEESGYFCFGEQLIPYAFIQELKKRIDPNDFRSEKVLNIYDILGFDYIAALDAKEYSVVSLCLSFLASEIKVGANYKDINVTGKSNHLAVNHEL